MCHVGDYKTTEGVKANSNSEKQGNFNPLWSELFITLNKSYTFFLLYYHDYSKYIFFLDIIEFWNNLV